MGMDVEIEPLLEEWRMDLSERGIKIRIKPGQIVHTCVRGDVPVQPSAWDADVRRRGGHPPPLPTARPRRHISRDRPRGALISAAVFVVADLRSPFPPIICGE